MVGLTNTIAKEWAPAFDIRANTIASGFIETRLTQAKDKGAIIESDGKKVELRIPGNASRNNSCFSVCGYFASETRCAVGSC